MKHDVMHYVFVNKIKHFAYCMISFSNQLLVLNRRPWPVICVPLVRVFVRAFMFNLHELYNEEIIIVFVELGGCRYK